MKANLIPSLIFFQVVAPLTKVGDLHAASSRSKAYFYVFDYQSKNSEYQQVSWSETFVIFCAHFTRKKVVEKVLMKRQICNEDISYTKKTFSILELSADTECSHCIQHTTVVLLVCLMIINYW